MEKNLTTRHVAVVEKCAMTEVALRHILNQEPDNNYINQFFKESRALKRELKCKNFCAVIFSLSGSRQSRMDGLLSLNEIAASYPNIRRIVLANDDAEARLIDHLMPACLHCILSKSGRLTQIQEQLLLHLGQTQTTHDISVGRKYSAYNSILSPTEQTILRYMTDGYSLSEIAVHLDRNIKTIRAHKFNAMAKLGVSSDIGLLSAADILMCLPVKKESRQGKCVAH